MSDQWSYCPYCGVKLIAAAKFCHACGTAVNDEEQTQTKPLQRKPEEELAEKPETPTRESETPLENLQSEATNESPVFDQQAWNDWTKGQKRKKDDESTLWKSDLWAYVLKSVLSLVVIVVATLIAAAGVELSFGVSRPGYTAIIAFAMYAPLLYY